MRALGTFSAMGIEVHLLACEANSYCKVGETGKGVVEAWAGPVMKGVEVRKEDKLKDVDLMICSLKMKNIKATKCPCSCIEMISARITCTHTT